MKTLTKWLAAALAVALAFAFYGMPDLYTAVAADTSPSPTTPSTVDPNYNERPGIQGVSAVGDMSVASSPIAVDDEYGNVLVRLYLLYKGSDLMNDRNLSMLEISPLVGNLADYPFQVTWSSYVLGMGDQIEGENLPYPGGGLNTFIRKYFPFSFKTKRDVINGTYPISFHVRYLHAGESPLINTPTEAELTVYVNITHGKDPETPTPTPTVTPEPIVTPKPQARVILQEYVMAPDEVTGGDSFDLKLALKNTHSSMTVRNMKCSLSEAEGTVLPESGSSSFYIESIAAEEVYEIDLRMQALPNAGITPVKMTLKMEYTDANDKYTETEEFTLPIHQVVNLRIGEPQYSPEANPDVPFNLLLQIYNVGKTEAYNTSVRLESDTMEADETLFAGTLAAGGQAQYDAMITIPSHKLAIGTPGEEMDPAEILPFEAPAATAAPLGDAGGAVLTGYSARAFASSGGVIMATDGMMGSSGGEAGVGTIQCDGTIVITYEDNMTVEYRKEIPITVNVFSYDQAYGNNDPYLGKDWDPDTGLLIDRETGLYYDPVTMEVVERGVNPFIYIGIAGGVVALGVTALIIVLRIQKKRRLLREQAMELELEAEREDND